jgi:hypothetical protein
MDVQKLVVWDNDSIGAAKETVRLIGGKALGLYQIRHIWDQGAGMGQLTTLCFSRSGIRTGDMIWLGRHLKTTSQRWLYQEHIRNA